MFVKRGQEEVESFLSLLSLFLSFSPYSLAKRQKQIQHPFITKYSLGAIILASPRCLSPVPD